jgi:hypothetical protein
MSVEKCGESYFITCILQQRVEGIRLKKGYKATFDRSTCKSCTRRDTCPITRLKKSGDFVYYLRDIDILKRLRLSYINTIPDNRKGIRSGIEATIRQFKCRTKAGKTRLRGLYRHKLWFTILALAINIKRICDYSTGVPRKRIGLCISSFSQVYVGIVKLIRSFLVSFGILSKGYDKSGNLYHYHVCKTWL